MRLAHAAFFVLVLSLSLLGGCDSAPREDGKGQNAPAAAPAAAAPASPWPAAGSSWPPLANRPTSSALATDSASHEVADLLYVSPLRYRNKDIVLEAYAAERYEVLEDGKLLRFWLRPGIRWTDGVELTAADVEFTYKLMIDPKTPTAYAEDYLSGCELRRDRQNIRFEVRYNEPFARALVTWAGSILPKHVLAGQDLMTTKYAHAPHRGPDPTSWPPGEPGRSLTLNANPDYFEGRAYIDQVVYRVIPDSSTMFLELKAGNLDMMGLTPAVSLPDHGTGLDSRWQKFKYLSFGYSYVGYNLKSPFFTDVRVRRAIAHAVNKESIIKGALLLGLNIPTISHHKPQHLGLQRHHHRLSLQSGVAKALLAEARGS